MSDSLQPHGVQHARFPCPSQSPGVCSNSCALSQWYHPTFSSSVTPFFSCPQSFPASGSFPMSWLFPSGGQSIGASASVLPMNIQGWFPLGLIGLISLLPKGLSGVFSSTASNSQYPLSRWCHPTILSSVVPFSSCLQSSQHQGIFQWVKYSHQVAKVLEFQL